jgi:serine protease Do
MNVLSSLNEALDELLERVRPALVTVGDGRGGAGAGILVGEGKVLTNAHVSRHGRSLKVVLANDAVYAAHEVAGDPDVDLALLEIETLGKAAVNGTRAVLSSQRPRPGEMVFALGHPWGERNVLTGGVLSAVTTARSRKGEVPILRADVQLAPGNSGGPLLNTAGEVIGLNAMIFGGDQSVAIPASVIRAFLEKSMPEMNWSKAKEAVL